MSIFFRSNLTGGRGAGRPPIQNTIIFFFGKKNNGRRCDDRPTTRKRQKSFFNFFFFSFFSCRRIHIETPPPPPPLSLYPKRSLQLQRTCNETMLSLGDSFDRKKNKTKSSQEHLSTKASSLCHVSWDGNERIGREGNINASRDYL